MASGNSISFATETPSFVIIGPPYDFWTTTFLPAGPIVIPTAFAILSMPSRNSSWAALSYFICFAVI